jgi:hypothetical protein
MPHRIVLKCFTEKLLVVYEYKAGTGVISRKDLLIHMKGTSSLESP